MTLIEAIRDIYEGLGEPSDLRYGSREDHFNVDITVAAQERAWKQLVWVVNRAQLAIASWKFPDSRQLRFSSTRAKSVMHTVKAIETVTGTAGEYVLNGAALGTYDQSGSWVVDVDGELAQVMYSDATQIILDRPLIAVFSGQVTLYRRRYPWVFVTNPATIHTLVGIPYGTAGEKPLVIQKITNADGTELELVDTAEANLTLSSPVRAIVSSYGVEFVEAPEEVESFVVEYSTGPKEFDSTTPANVVDLQLSLPPQFHDAIVLWGLWWGYRRAQENSSAYSTKRDLDDFLRRTRSESDFIDDVRVKQFTVEME